MIYLDTEAPIRQTRPQREWRSHLIERTIMAVLLDFDDLPVGFTYPHGFIRVVELGLTNLDPWWIMEGDQLPDRFIGIKRRYAQRRLVPFARREDNDDIACFDVDSGKVAIIHDFASQGYEQRTEFADFYSWLRQAIEDLIAFE